MRVYAGANADRSERERLLVGLPCSFARRCGSSAHGYRGDWVNWSPPPQWRLEKGGP